MENKNVAEKQSFVETVVVGDKRISFNCHPEDVKKWAKEEQPGPNIIVLGDTAVHNDVPLANPEFPLLKSIFMQGGFDFAKKQVTQPLILVGTKKRVKAFYDALRLAFHGPSYQELRNQIRVDAKTRKLLLADQKYFANKNSEGEVIPFECFVVQKPFDKNGCALIDDELCIQKVLNQSDNYVVHFKGQEIPVKLTSDGEIGPSWTPPELKGIETPHQFRVFVLGSDSGFGKGPTTGYLIEMNGEYILWDCPPYVSVTLANNAIDPGEIKKIIISHIHDDHCNDLVKFARNGHGRIEIIATKEIIYSLKQKLAALMDISVVNVEHLFFWREIKVGTPTYINGYCFDFHYGFHPIPSLGATVTYNGNHLVTITGDTGFATVLEPAYEASAITATRKKQILDLLKNGKLIFADVGKAMIHGDPADLDGLELPHIQIYHTSDVPEKLQKKVNLAKPGNVYDAYAIIEMNPTVADVALIASVLNNLGIAESLKLVWTKNLSMQSEIWTKDSESVIIQQGSVVDDFFFIITHGKAEVVVNDHVVATLGKGDFFGEEALLTGNARNASIQAKTKLRLIAVPSALFKEMMREDFSLASELTGEKDPSCAITRLKKIWANRLVISQVRAFHALPAGKRNEIASKVQTMEFAPKEVIVRKGSTTDEVYIIARGKVEVKLNQPEMVNPILGVNELFGENVVLGYAPSRTCDVTAIEHTVVYMIPGEVFLRLYNEIPFVHIELITIKQERTVKVAS